MSATAVILAVAALAGGPAPPAPAGCQWFGVQVVGDFNDWNPATPGMQLISPCVWADTLDIDPGCYYMKFRTDFFWGSDYGRCFGEEGLCQSPVPPDGSALVKETCIVDGSNAIGQLEFAQGGAYEFVLDEALGQYRIRRVGDGGNPTGSISGELAFADDPPVNPDVAVVVFPAGAPNPIVILWTADSFFQVTGLGAGTYDLAFFSEGYELVELGGIPVKPPGDTSVGTILLAPEICEPAFFAMQVVGGFNDWDSDVASMSREGCVWSDTLSVPAGCHLMKFRTDNAWDFPPDLGRCFGEEGICEIPVPPDGTSLTGPTCFVQGVGTALGEIEFHDTGEYEFTLDEQTFEFAIRFLGPPISVRPESWGGVKARYRSPR